MREGTKAIKARNIANSFIIYCYVKWNNTEMEIEIIENSGKSRFSSGEYSLTTFLVPLN